jgi:CheY-like chemotaxis protein
MKIETLLSFGMDDVITKPFVPENFAVIALNLNTLNFKINSLIKLLTLRL